MGTVNRGMVRDYGGVEPLVQIYENGGSHQSMINAAMALGMMTSPTHNFRPLVGEHRIPDLLIALQKASKEMESQGNFAPAFTLQNLACKILQVHREEATPASLN